jgi:hypothetical protein
MSTSTTTETDQEPDKAEVYRARFAIKLSSSGSTGDWRYYESREQLAGDLLAAQLDVLLEEGNRSATRHVYRQRRLWRDFLKGDDYPKVTKVLSVDRFEGGRWVPLAVEFHEPSITITDAEV